ncbi:MAG TPA: transcriptional activator NhaR [Anaeromyxobacter sp.]|nr:transcriptional activator NhaR [Anaeromyxobacter sp.]
MEWLNYHHLLYFWTVARAGSIARASEELRLAQPTISNQLKTLESSLGVKLLERQGRRLVLTDVGRTVLRYADDIFRTGSELQRAVKGLPTGQRLRLVAGVADVIPKRMAALLLQPAVDAHPDLVLVCREGPLPQLLAALAIHEIDVVVADVPAPEDVKVKAFSHLLGHCGTTFFAAQKHAGLRKGFPRSLAGAPVLLPAPGTALRRALDAWFESLGIAPAVAGEFDDSALMKAFGARGLGVFAAPTVLEEVIRRQYGVAVVGRAEDVRERFYAITVERRLRHPAVVAVAETARDEIFGAR